eukprot:1153644-Pelagomonas_calceolata.AAC.3
MAALTHGIFIHVVNQACTFLHALSHLCMQGATMLFLPECFSFIGASQSEVCAPRRAVMMSSACTSNAKSVAPP